MHLNSEEPIERKPPKTVKVLACREREAVIFDASVKQVYALFPNMCGCVGLIISDDIQPSTIGLIHYLGHTDPDSVLRLLTSILKAVTLPIRPSEETPRAAEMTHINNNMVSFRDNVFLNLSDMQMSTNLIVNVVRDDYSEEDKKNPFFKLNSVVQHDSILGRFYDHVIHGSNNIVVTDKRSWKEYAGDVMNRIYNNRNTK